jgi:hypothetical protein
MLTEEKLTHGVRQFSSNEKLQTKTLHYLQNIHNLLRQGRIQGGDCQAAAPPPQTSQNYNLKNTDFVHAMISEVTCNLPFNQNQPLKLADD